ncbi:MAG: hypothetical protein ACE5KT_09510 [Methanosarcinales archaeon]
MLIDASSYRNLEIIGVIESVEDLETVKQIKEELGTISCNVYEVTEEELNQLLRYLEIIAEQIDKQISVELKKDNKLSVINIFNPKSARGKISLHYGELYLLARAISHQDTILCDDESVLFICSLLNGICGVELDIIRTIEYLHSRFRAGKISAIDFVNYFEKMKNLGLINIRIPPKNIKDESTIDVLLKFMYYLAEYYDGQ